MKKQRAVLLDLTGPVAVLAQSFYEWAITVREPSWVSPPFVMIRTGMFNEFIEAVLYEIFKEHYLSGYIDQEAESNKYLREQGMPPELVLKLKCDFLNTVVSIIYRVLPEINFLQVENCDYGLCDVDKLLLHLNEDVNSPMYLAATPPPMLA